MTATEDERLDALGTTIHESPGQADWEVLCSLLGSEEVPVKREAEELRHTLIDTHPDLAAATDELIGLLSTDGSIRRIAIDTLSRVVRSDPRPLTPRVRELLTSDDIRAIGGACYVLAGLAKQCPTVAKPSVSTLIALLGHEDLRVRSLAMYTLNNASSSYPTETSDAVPKAVRLLEYQGIAGGTPDQPGVTPVTNREVADRLTPRFVRPRKQAAEFLATIADTSPEAVIFAIDRCIDLIAELDVHDPGRSSAIEALSPLAIHCPDELIAAGSIPVLESCLETDPPNTTALQILSDLGEDLSPPERIPMVTPVDRDEPVRDGDLERARAIEMEIHHGENVDMDEVLRLLRSSDTEVRDAAAFSAQFLTDNRVDELHARGEEFLALVGEPHDCTRKHLIEGLPGLLTTIASAYPREWKPPLMELLDADSPRVRADALSIMSDAATSYPHGFRTELERYVRYLDDDHPLVRNGALSVIGSVATRYPAAVAVYLPSIATTFDDTETRVGALAVLERIAEWNPGALAPVSDAVIAVGRDVDVETIDAGETVTDPLGNRVRLTDDDPTVRLLLAVLSAMAEHDPALVHPIQSELVAVAEAEIDECSQMARGILETLT